MHQPRNALSHLRNALLALAVASAALAAPSLARAQDQEDRLAALELQIEHDEAAAERWFWSWLGINSGFAIGAGVWAALTDDPGIRVEQIVGAVSGVIGVAMLLILPPPALSGPNDLAEPADDDDELPETRAERAEAILERNAEGQHEQHALLNHILCFAFAIASGAFLWIGYDRLLGGALQAGGVILTGELQILTHPTGAIDFLGR
jgi:hypothetical protein